MGKLILIGKWFKGKKSTVIDLDAFREMKGNRKGNGFCSKSEAKEDQEDKKPKQDQVKRYPWDFLPKDKHL